MGKPATRVVTLFEAVRRRPGMYFGANDAAGLHHAVMEIVGNVIDLHLAQNATTLHVDIEPDAWVTVRDDGPGIPPSIATKVLTELHTDGTFDGHQPHVHLTKELFGVGIAAVSAASSELEMETTFEGVRYRQTFANGTPTSPLANLGASPTEGSTIRFRPDARVFTTNVIDLRMLREHLQDLAWMNPLLRIFLCGERLRARGGLLGWVKTIATDPVALFATRSEIDGVRVEMALGWRSAPKRPVIHSFVNQNRSIDGTHVDGLWEGFVRHRGSKAITTRAMQDLVSPGLVAVVHVSLMRPEYQTPTRDHLRSPEARDAVAATLVRDLPTAVSTNVALRDHLTKMFGRVASAPVPRRASSATSKAKRATKAKKKR